MVVLVVVVIQLPLLLFQEDLVRQVKEIMEVQHLEDCLGMVLAVVVALVQ
jgi:hypothetical protein